MKTLSELCGHTTTRMTEHYAAYLGMQSEHMSGANVQAIGGLS